MSTLRVIPGHPHYMVSESGEVFSIRSNRYLKPVQASGYLCVDLGRGNRRLVHRLVASAFIPNPDGKPEVNHRDGDGANNAAPNLEWVTSSENHVHARLTIPRRQHALARPVVVGDRRYESQSEAARALGVAVGAVALAVRQGYKCQGQEVRYA